MTLLAMEQKEIHEDTKYYILVCFPKEGYGEHYKNVFTHLRNARTRARKLLESNPEIDHVMIRLETVWLRVRGCSEFSSSKPFETVRRS